MSENMNDETTAGPKQQIVHTPGPWTIRGGSIFGNRLDVGHQGSIACTRTHSSNMVDCEPESEANALLIAAAPRMFDALQSTLAYLQLRADGESNELWANVAAVLTDATGQNVE